jgi:hypothetical protein
VLTAEIELPEALQRACLCLVAVVYSDEDRRKARHMTRKKAQATKTQGASFVHGSISFLPGLCETPEDIAKQKKVSRAWVVRDAAEQHLTEKPALPGRQV